LPELRMHYYSFGTPQKDATGRTTNAVLILHGTGGSGQSLLRPIFAGCFLARASCSTATVISSSFLTTSATANRASPVTACTRTFRNTITTTW
jgi:predicted esterase